MTRLSVEPSLKRVRVMFNGKTVADSLCAALMLEEGKFPVYYFPREDVRMDCLQSTRHRTHCPHKGEASYWNLKLGDRVAENAVWSFEKPQPAASRVAGWLAFQWDGVDGWFEEEEEVFGHPHDPYHLIDIRASSRVVRVALGGEQIAFTRRALFVFETGLPPRHYLPPADVREEFLKASALKTTCAYKGEASYWSVHASGKRAENAVWSYPRPNAEYARIKGYYCFYPEKVDSIEVEGERTLRGGTAQSLPPE